MPSYFSVVTLAGQQKIAESVAGGAAINITHLAVGDGNGLPTAPAVGATSLVHEVWRGSVTSAVRDPVNPTQVIVTATVPLAVGPFSIREAAIVTSDGALFAIANYPETYKPSPVEGTASEIVIEFVVVIDTAASVAITISPSSMIPAHLLLRQPFISVDSVTATAPPASPTLGALHVVPPDASGAWAGHTHHLAQWTGSEWVFVDAPERTVIGVIDQGIYMRRTPTGWVTFHASVTERGLIRLATTTDLAVNDATTAVTPSLLSAIGLSMPLRPEILNANATITAACTLGQVALAAGVSWVHRGLHKFSTDSFSASARTFATAASKVYHLRWYPPGHFLAPSATYPFGRLMLRDLADAGYNPTALTEADVAFDTSYDDMLIALVSTDAANNPTALPLRNRARLSMSATHSGTPTDPPPYEFGYTSTFTGDVGWAVTPKEHALHGYVYSGSPGSEVSGGVQHSFAFDRYAYSLTVLCDWNEAQGAPASLSSKGYVSLAA